MKDQIIGIKIDTKEDHGNSYHYLKVYRIACHTVVFDPEATGSCRTEGNGQGIKKRHAPDQQEDDFYDSHSQIDQV